MELFLGYLIIFGARILDVSISVVRTILVVRGKKFQAAMLGCVEVFIYITVLTKIMSQLDNIGNLIAYSLGFGSGQIVGIWLEQKIALGHVSYQIITKGNRADMIKALRDEGFAVTVVEGNGRDGKRHILNMVVKRNLQFKLHKILDEFDKDAFVTIKDTKHISGGYMKRK
ncbi:DUF2179 domain-containing protein [Anaeromicrobium sediminis]|uniref:UPF0316 protein CCE28_14685 n=1 Tax=Anaeromicrobium sediminis TaxID=1478221 RepID=A0A267MG37_9FIRM|nr:DUF5698 domain-containing protein [Anaeromicrobium sediminis]PAB58541.1 hypothetical protein CCE28_14685 [Anaeromicrobium sediminis]